jgi:hypothetical protein
MIAKPIAQPLHRLLRLGALVAAMTCATAASPWSSKNTILSDDVHSQAIDRVFAKLPQRRLDLLKKAQAIVDADQDAGQSAEHAMTGIERKQDTEAVQRALYVQRSEAALHCWILEALDLAAVGDMDQAMLILGRAVHLLQDATSQPHRPCQVWRFDFGLFDKLSHIRQELTYPDKPLAAELECATRWAYEIFSGSRPMPEHFFRPDHQLDLPTDCVRT